MFGWGSFLGVVATTLITWPAWDRSFDNSFVTPVSKAYHYPANNNIDFLQFDYKYGHNSGSEYHFCMKLSGFFING